MSSTPRPDAEDLPGSLPEDAAAKVQQQNDGAFTAETPQRRAQSGAPTVEPPDDGS